MNCALFVSEYSVWNATHICTSPHDYQYRVKMHKPPAPPLPTAYSFSHFPPNPTCSVEWIHRTQLMVILHLSSIFTWWGCCGLCLWHNGDVAVYVFDVNQPNLPTPFLFCSCVCFYLYGASNCISFHKFSRQLSALSLSVLPVLFLPNWFFQLYISLWKSPSALI